MQPPVVEAVRARGPAPTDRKRQHCPLCRSELLQPWLALPHNRLLKCPGCGLRSTERLGSDVAIADYYRSRSAHAGKLEHDQNAAPAIATLQADLLSAFIGSGPGQLLEIGCAGGHLLAVMEAKRWQCWGVDLSETSLQEAQARTQATLHLGTINNLSTANASFDCVAAFDLLAHLSDPVATIGRAADLLRPGGWLILSTVNEGWPLVPVFQRLFMLFPEQTAALRDEMYEAQHYCYFDQSTVHRLLRDAGLRPYKTQPLAPLSARYFRAQYPLAKRLALSTMLGLDRLMGASRKMLVVARKPLDWTQTG